MDLSYGNSAIKFGHADYYGNRNSGVSIKDLYNYVNRNQHMMSEGNRWGGADGLSDEVRRDYQNWEREETRKRDEERRRQEEQRRAQEESQRRIMETRANERPAPDDTIQPKAESYIKLNFSRPEYGSERSSTVSSFDPYAAYNREKTSESRSYVPSYSRGDGEEGRAGYGLNLRRNAKEKSSNWLKLQDRREQRMADREASSKSYIGRAY